MTGSDIAIIEVGLVDGLQSIEDFVPTADKMQWISAEVAAGLRHMEVTSFVPAKLLPQFVDAEEVLAHALTLPGLGARVLIPNLKGAQRAVAAGARSLSYAFSVSEAHSHSNVRKSRDAQFADFVGIMEFRRSLEPARRPYVSVGFATSFGCSIQGTVSERDVIDFACRFVEAGADDIALADTVGYATPHQVTRVVRSVRTEIGERLKGIHLHDTRGLGLANAVAALDEGIREIDASLGGLGGCPFAPGATGNIVLEDLVYMVEAMGFRTGVHLESLLELRRWVTGLLAGDLMRGSIVRAGLPKTFTQTS